MKDLFYILTLPKQRILINDILCTKITGITNNTKKIKPIIIKTHPINKYILPCLFYNTSLPLK